MFCAVNIHYNNTLAPNFMTDFILTVLDLNRQIKSVIIYARHNSGLHKIGSSGNNDSDTLERHKDNSRGKIKRTCSPLIRTAEFGRIHTIELFGYYSDIIRILFGYYSDIIRILFGYYSDIIRILFGYYSDIIRILFGYYSDTIRFYLFFSQEFLYLS